MKSHMLLSPLWKISSWKKLFLCGKKSLEKPTVELPHEIIESEVLPRLHATVELPREIIESEVLPRLHATVELPHEIIESEVLPRLHATVELPREIIESEVLPRIHATVELPHEIIESEVLPKLHATVELSRDITEWEILPRLPVETLCQFMFVCKQWKSHISTCDQFARKNLQHINKETLTHKVLEIDRRSKTFSTRDCGDLNNQVRSIPFSNEAHKVLLLASLDGLVFVELVKIVNEQQEMVLLANLVEPVSAELLSVIHEYAFWNPLTGAYKKLSNSPKYYSPYDAFGLYFDSINKEYKVLQLICVGGAFKALVYSQRLNSTKEIQLSENHQQRLSDLRWSTPISLGESLYFIGKRLRFGNHGQIFWIHIIIVFDVKSEKIREIPFDLLNQENQYKYAILMVIKGCIHILVSRCLKVGAELFSLDDDRDGDKWTEVKDFPPAGNHPWTYDEKIIDMEALLPRTKIRDMPSGFSKRKLPRRNILYLETLVSPSCYF